jgi:hypothetical protein
MPTTSRVFPVVRERRRRSWRRRAWLAGVVLAAIGVVYWEYLAQVPVDYSSDVDHFLHGSIGSDGYDGIPLRIWKVLPEMFPEYLPEQGAGYLRVPESERTYLDGYATFGMIVEKGRSLPVGFSQRRVYVDRVGLNCALCHTSTIRVTDGLDAERIYGVAPTYIERRARRDGDKVQSVLILGMPANTIDLEAYFVFLFKSASDPRFTSDNVLAAIKRQAERTGEALGFVESFILHSAVGRLRDTLLERKHQLHYLSGLPHDVADAPAMPPFGPGRVDTFSPYKSIQFGFPYDGKFGIADYPSIWNQRPREQMHLHWDGNNSSVFERNISASLGAGATPVSLDMNRMLRVARWIGAPPPPNPEYGGSKRPLDASEIALLRDNPFPQQGELPIPQYPFRMNEALAAAGRHTFENGCASCHGWKGLDVGQVVDIATIKTDTARLDSYTEELQANQNLLGAGHWWRFSNFRKTNGYANSPLDGVWARAPYLHNGSIPTLSDLLNAPCKATDLKGLGIANEDDWNKLSEDSARVAKIIKDARAANLRPPVFYRGDDHYDDERVGWRCDRAVSDDGRKLFLFRTFEFKHGEPQRLRGNGHEGHEFGTKLSADDKRALIEYQKAIDRRHD